jgi:large subunit ribosomal protein L14
MIQVQTLLKVADNSGGKVVRCLKILKKGTKPRYGKIGDVIVVSVQKIRAKNKLTSKVKKGDVLYSVIIKTKNGLNRKLGLSYSFNENSVVLLNKQFKPLASRVLGLVPRELRNEKFSKIISLSSGTI